ncbi:hypothetical protein A2630_04230 [Candidatus Woesebacteria bacterium RIFCSPHIGHO2_01_FULL_44_10]|uniref:Type-4 uracil-DNA glycosylase n=1 Tax=Candidatus Woesebacteria bacterium RIFCSPLOWO2_01_FULL_44_14 TaxID=1802525 RepID=A0A1F8C1K5_9BACT|nr:MAG: hypothetical protein A2630_04230 [Candidatus Woesebacteria bacterium RIFCSPHIGHO2_01_FULL_44_10]OGM55452.1 MAG: hypothetical protein A3F62_00465 [Candidatus Woesebacteria bacterium RIFCSPHIGHO2_12_FULL_44_11]OGM70142.1 MAG: hypothetical protein A2975_03645 [Candidatus Woesebacteria bacterium RIFCSPLOWO2_01_FULL_44_14]
MTKREKLIKLREKALADKKLPKFEGATKLVFGAGNAQAQILMLGESPGYWEDVKGIPFVGNAGKLLDQALQSIEVPRGDVFITNVVLYRPPGNRDPNPDEIEAFSPYIDGIIDILAPRVIVTLGRFSMAKFLPGVFISSVHGKPKEVSWKDKKIIVVPMYHPAAALRNGDVKAKMLRDFVVLKDVLESRDKLVDDKIKLEQMKLV